MADNRIEIPLKRRHTEYQDIYDVQIYPDANARRITCLLAAIADRLTDIADTLEEQKKWESLI